MAKSLKKNAILNIVRSIMNLLYPLITFPYTSRVLMPDGIGRVRFAQSIVSYFVLIAGLGITNYGIREAARLREDQESFNTFCKELFIINVCSTVIAFLLFLGTIFIVPKFESMIVLLLICSLAIIFELFTLNWLFIAVEEFSYITIRSIGFQIVSLILLFVMVKTKEDYIKYALLTVIGTGGSGICNFIYSRKFFSFKVHTKLNFKRHLKPVFTFFAVALIINIYTVFDTSMLGFLSTETQVGYYNAATKLNKLVLAMITAACTVVFPRLSSLASKNDDDFYQLFYKTISFVLFFSIPAMVGLNLLTPQIIYLFCGELYMPASTTMRVMNPIIVIIGLGYIMGSQFFISIKKEKYTVISVGLGATVNFILNFILIPKYGSLGAGIATLCAETMVTTSYFFFARHMISLKYVAKDFFQYLIAVCLMACGILAIKFFVSDSNFLLWLSVFSGALIYAIVLILLRNQMAVKLLDSALKKIGLFKHSSEI